MVVRQTAATGPTLRARAGMTLMEIMVSVGILAGMILAFNIILTQSQKLVSRAQKTMRANSVGTALGQVIRRDIRSITKNGFLSIDATSMVFTTAGVCESVTGNARANASVVCFKLADNAAAGHNDKVLCRYALLLTKDAGDPPSSDVWSADLADIQEWDASGLSTLLSQMRGAETVHVPPVNLGEVEQLWKVLTHNVKSLEIRYRTRDASGNLSNWESASHTWTHHDQDAWPVVVRIRVELDMASEIAEVVKDPNDPTNLVKYELICPIGG